MRTSLVLRTRDWMGQVRLLPKRFFIFAPKLKNWWLYLFDTLGFLRYGKLYTFAYKNGTHVSFRAGTYDTLINFEIFGKGEYTEHFMADVSDFRTFVDLGAQTGVFTLNLLSRNSSLRGTCVEATSTNFEVLKRNVMQNGFSDRITLLHKAAWSRTGEQLVINMSNHNTGGHSVIMNDSGRTQGESVETISLKDIIGTEQCDLLKVDVEGAEYDILYTTDNETLAKIRHIVMEAHRVDYEKKNAPEVARFLTEHGFTVTREGRHVWAKREA